jgi:putative endonuclease
VSKDRARTGSIGEDAVLELYLRSGYGLVARNWRCQMGEIDLVMIRAGTLVICEVKARRGTRFGPGWEAVTQRKQAKLRALAEVFLARSGLAPPRVRFDVASVRLGRGRSASVDVFEDAF